MGSLIGGLTTQTVSMPQKFRKQHKTGVIPIEVETAHVTFSTSTDMCKIKFSVHKARSEDGEDDDEGGCNQS